MAVVDEQINIDRARVILREQRLKRSDGKCALVARGHQYRDRLLPAQRKVTRADTACQKNKATKIMPERIGCEQQGEDGAKG